MGVGNRISKGFSHQVWKVVLFLSFFFLSFSDSGVMLEKKENEKNKMFH